jgi:3-methyladenine DNA glycosylase AlkD
MEATAMTPTPRALAKQLLDGLLTQANPATARQGQTFFKQPVSLIGVNAPIMRALARAVFGPVKGSVTQAEAVAVCDRLLPDSRLEVKLTGLCFLACLGKRLDGDLFGVARRWIEAGHCDSWAVIDELGVDVLGPLLQRQTQHVSVITDWPRSPNLWLRRAAMVVLVKPARRGLLLDEVYAAAGVLLADPEDLVQKAVGWLLREAGKTDMERLGFYLQQHGAGCARTTLRYAIERFAPQTRQHLLETTRRPR